MSEKVGKERLVHRSMPNDWKTENYRSE